MRGSAIAALPLLLALLGCRGERGKSVAPDLAAPQDNIVRRTIPPQVLARQAVAYSGYRGTQSPNTHNYPTAAQIQEDLQLLVRGGWTFIRLFDCSQHAARVLQVIKDNGLDIKVMSGVWIAGPKAMHDQDNNAEIERCVALDHQYKDIIVAVSVGNETLDSWSDVRVPPAELAAYITAVRARITQPVTTDDMTPPFTFAVSSDGDYSGVIAVARVVDFLSLHVYAFLDAPYDSWDWKQLAVPAGPARAVAMMDAAMAYTKSSIAEVASAMKSNGLDLPILIGEAGWKTTPTGIGGDPSEVFRAHPVNQKMFYDRLRSWVYGSGKTASSPLTAFYFEAFDEPWKAEDDGWGLFDTNRASKYVMWGSFADKKPKGAATYNDNDALYYQDRDSGVGGAVDAN